MKTAKGVIQGYNGVAAVDEKHQIIVHAQAYGAGQEQHTLLPMLTGIANLSIDAPTHLSARCQ